MIIFMIYGRGEWDGKDRISLNHYPQRLRQSLETSSLWVKCTKTKCTNNSKPHLLQCLAFPTTFYKFFKGQ